MSDLEVSARVKKRAILDSDSEGDELPITPVKPQEKTIVPTPVQSETKAPKILTNITSPPVKSESLEMKSEPQKTQNENKPDDKLTLSGKIPKKIKPNEHPNTTNKHPTKDIPRKPDQKPSSSDTMKKPLQPGAQDPQNTAMKPIQKSVSSDGTKTHPTPNQSIKPHSNTAQATQKPVSNTSGTSPSVVKKAVQTKSITQDNAKKPLLQKRPANNASIPNSSVEDGSYSDSNTSSSGSASDTSESEIEQPVVKKKKISSEEAAVVRKRAQPEKKSDSVRKSTLSLSLNKKGPVNLKQKEEIVQEILKRWWYVLPDWPPVDYNYEDLLVNAELRRVDLELWKLEPNVDESGKKKVFELEWFKGVFKDFEGKTYDFRPRESCPCFTELNKKDKKDLLLMLKTAVDNQMKSLESSEVYDPKIQKTLSRELHALRSQVVKLV